MDAGCFEYGKPHLVAVAIKCPRKPLGDHGSHSCGFYGFRGNGPAGRTTEIASGNEDVALLNLLRKLRVQRFEDMLCHFRKALPDNAGGRDLIRGNVVSELPAVSFEYHGEILHHL